MSTPRYGLPAVVLILAASGLVFADSSRETKPPTENPFLQSEFNGRDGAAEAARDLEKNSARYCIYGRTAGLIYLREWSSLTKERFDVKVEPIAGCFVMDDLIAYAKAYNQTVLEHVARTYGATAWEDCSKQAAADYRAKRKQLQ